MKRDFLESLGLEKEVVDKIMAENGADLEKEKAKTTAAKADLADVRGELTAAKTELDALKASSVDAAAIQKKFDDLQAKYDTDTKALQDRLSDRDYSDAITAGIAKSGLKFSSKSAERAFTAALREKKLELKDGELTGLDDFIKAQKEADPDAFAPDKPAPRFTAGSGSGGGHGEPSKAQSRAAQLAAEHHVSLYGESKKE